MINVNIENNRLIFGKGFEIVLERTLRIPDDGNNYPLPPGLGSFPIHNINDYRDTVPQHWLNDGGYFIPMYQREAMWIRFNGRNWRPNAVKVGLGLINAVSGQKWSRILQDETEDYIVAPPQPWLDGINVGEGVVRQFVAMPLGEGYTVEAQLSDEEELGGLQFVVYEPKRGLFPEEQPKASHKINDVGVLGLNIASNMMAPMAGSMVAMDMGLGAGGAMKQKIYEDPHGIDTWDEDNSARVFIRIVNSESYKAITGLEAPESTISAEAYTKYGFPWFDVYDEQIKAVGASEELGGVKSIKDIDLERDLTLDSAEVALDIDDSQIVKYKSLESLSNAEANRNDGDLGEFYQDDVPVE